MVHERMRVAWNENPSSYRTFLSDCFQMTRDKAFITVRKTVIDVGARVFKSREYEEHMT